jgi:predicted secreted protein
MDHGLKLPVRKLTRRKVLAGGLGLTAGLLAGGPAVAQSLIDRAADRLTDLEGFDPLWRDAEYAINIFFPGVKFEDQGLHLDLPEQSDVGSFTPMTVRFDTAMTKQDHPVVVHILAHNNPSPHVMSAWFKPEAGRAEFSTRIRLETSQKVTAVAQMSDGRYLRKDVNVGVSLGACGQVGSGGNDDVNAYQPETRVSVPVRAKSGEIIPIRAVIAHPQETGMRRDPYLGWIDQRIVSRFGCTYRGVEFFRARLYPAIATNPYFAFYARAEQNGTFEFSWYDMFDITYTNKAAIIVT